MTSRLHREGPRFESGRAHYFLIGKLYIRVKPVFFFMRKNLEKYWFPLTLGVLIVAGLVVVILMIIGSGDEPKGRISADLEDSRIRSGEETRMVISARNTGSVPLIGYFNVSVDDPDSVEIYHPDPELLSFNLLPGDSIERRVNVQAVSKAYRTDYELTVNVVDVNDTRIGSDSAILSVRR